MTKALHLNLKRKWFDMIKSGEKKEEYREQSTYWHARLMENRFGLEIKEFDTGVFYVK